ncbi:ribosomal protein S18-alanine N-acetyltransferase [Galbitalea soli]|uniref:Ribosomal protein S18-alanine N-acetyltransferase n=1 Tax=Galbitalea soli TaxID=1268042 RepID=A0A7C9TQE6_9MICO|nr:ribosomal protein S18-alanine N-acetyltransferase [Galbitalea soli]NEM91258.1 ribosomal protein S18-alanine N-acetyltransferase [Galbitalea soli]NYJ29947.1 ribosomal-protein-alanine acetyltransferase [Galbitalea soli]
MTAAAPLRLATLADLDAIMRLEESTFTNDAWTVDSMRAELHSRHSYYLVAEQPDTPGLLGYAGLLAPEGSADADIQTIAVAPAARRRGLGRQLMEALIAEARARRCRTIFLEVRADNPTAQHLYDTLGFEQIAVRPRYYQPDDVDANIMRLELHSDAAAVGA